MAQDLHRSTYIFNQETIRALNNLAQIWKVSKSHAVRKAIQLAHQALPQNAKRTPLQVLLSLANPQGTSPEQSLIIPTEKIEHYLEDLKQERLANDARLENMDKKQE